MKNKDSIKERFVSTRELKKDIVELKGIVIALMENMEKQRNAEEELLTLDGAAELMGVTRKTIQNWVCEKKIPAYRREGKGTYFIKSELIEAVKKHPLY